MKGTGRACLIRLALLAPLFVESGAQPGGETARVHERLPLREGPLLYTGNRPPLSPNPLVKLPIGRTARASP